MPVLTIPYCYYPHFIGLSFCVCVFLFIPRTLAFVFGNFGIVTHFCDKFFNELVDNDVMLLEKNTTERKNGVELFVFDSDE